MRKYVDFGAYGGKKLLEVSVGQGTDLVQFAKGGAEVFGIDITQRHPDLASRNFAPRGLTSDLRYANAAALPFARDSFDVVYSLGVLHHADDLERCIAECLWASSAKSTDGTYGESCGLDHLRSCNQVGWCYAVDVVAMTVCR